MFLLFFPLSYSIAFYINETVFNNVRSPYLDFVNQGLHSHISPIFTSLAFRKGVSESEVTSEEREHTKRIVYSIVYGAGEYSHEHTLKLTCIVL